MSEEHYLCPECWKCWYSFIKDGKLHIISAESMFTPFICMKVCPLCERDENE